MGIERSTGLLLATAIAMLGARAAFAQLPNVQVPNVPLPNLPRVGLPADVARTVDGVAGRALEDVRRLRVRELLRTNRTTLERDPRGEAMVRNELIAFSPADEALNNAQAQGFEIVRRRTLEGLDETLVILAAPRGMSTRRALQRLRALDPGGTYDFNHVYVESGEAALIDAAARSLPDVAPSAALAPGARLLAAAAAIAPGAGSLVADAALVPGAGLLAADAALVRGAGLVAVAQESGPGLSGVRPRIGLIDGGVDTAHPVFQDVRVRQHGCADKPVPSTHGTAVASLIAGRSGNFHGALPTAELFAADVYCGIATGGAVDTVADAMAWMARERVPVVNVSLVGPENVTLAAVVRVLIARGHVIVAAVGNDGPSARPLYPASYPGVVGVTGVDARKRVLIEACRGKQVDFAAPGADMAAAMSAQSFAVVRGTSFAAPIVAGLLASQLAQPDRSAAEQAIAQLARQALDLGSRGVDRTYGNGLVGDSVRIEPTLAGLGK